MLAALTILYNNIEQIYFVRRAQEPEEERTTTELCLTAYNFVKCTKVNKTTMF